MIATSLISPHSNLPATPSSPSLDLADTERVDAERADAAQALDDAALAWRAQTFLANRDALIVTDVGGYILDWNPAAERIYGYTREEMLGQSTAKLHPPEDAPTLT